LGLKGIGIIRSTRNFCESVGIFKKYENPFEFLRILENPCKIMRRVGQYQIGIAFTYKRTLNNHHLMEEHVFPLIQED
jgi:hypothetical protein